VRISKAIVSRITAVALLSATLVGVSVGTAEAAARPTVRNSAPDALTKSATTELDAFAGWLRANKARGFIGEVGWPNDDPRWNALAEQWYARADAANLAVTTYVASEWGYGHQLSGYGRSNMAIGSPLDTARPNALVAESHIGTTTALRGVNLTGPEMGTPAIDATSTFSNLNVGELEHTYHYDGAATFEYLAGRGVRSVRLPFRWERVQRAPYGALDIDEMSRLATAVRAADAAGLRVILDMHNFGSYYLHDSASGLGVRRALGSAQLPITAFTDVWARLSRYFAGENAVYAFDLMNEPVGMAPRGRTTAARVWEQASQQALNVIRAGGDRRPIMVAGYDWSGLTNWAKNHPTSWIKDPARNFSYEAHHYFDARRSGVYGTYDAELAAARG
jgi:hypothetical protein